MDADAWYGRSASHGGVARHSVRLRLVRVSAITKRVLDIVLGSVLALLATPVILLLAACLAVQLRCWPFFVQERVGRGGRSFRFVKLRSLPVLTPRYADKYTISDLPLPRSLRLLRASHLDELPQLFLVPLGRMSLVGPRPEMSDLHKLFPPSLAAARTAVRPGCTGAWQISPSRALLICEDTSYDEFYLAHANPVLDLWLLAKTALVMAHLSRPVELDGVPRRVSHPLGARSSGACGSCRPGIAAARPSASVAAGG
jgi:lipopolysaccharide/colanic/teichoic acid biosynthesis glycosyltransferase